MRDERRLKPLSNDPNLVRDNPNLDFSESFFERLFSSSEELSVLGCAGRNTRGACAQMRDKGPQLRPINVAPMSNGADNNPLQLRIRKVKDAVIANTNAKSIAVL